MAEEIILEMRGIIKDFPGVRAVDNVDFELKKGEVHALVGKNGAGKSTLIKILAGAYLKDKGEIFFQGEKVDIHNIWTAQNLGLGFVYQEAEVVPYFNVLENMFIGNELTRSSFKLVDRNKMRGQAAEVLNQLGIQLDLKANIKELTPSQKQLITIGRALLLKAKVLV
ncbi:sugar ABC transporter ATP-binding protein, partial [bacterium]|nr:sugar ABC transporter ATP-binding protein [bacterium]